METRKVFIRTLVSLTVVAGMLFASTAWAQSMPDLVAKISISSAKPNTKPNICNDVTVQVFVENRGTRAAPQSRLYLEVAGERSYRTIPALEPGQSHQFSQSARFREAADYPVMAMVDDDARIQELSESNNRASTRFWVDSVCQSQSGNGRLPDLVVTSVWSPDYKRHLGRTFKILVTVKNAGQGPSGPFEVKLRRPKDSQKGMKYEEARFPNLNRGQAQTFTFSFRYYSDRGEKVCTAYADPDRKIAESNERNNVQRIKIWVK